MFKKKSYQTRQKARFVTHFLTYMYVRFVVKVYFLVPNDQPFILYGPYLFTYHGDARWLSWLHFEKWAFLYYQHNFKLSINVD